ncbi:MAG: tetratricopeptide repeat protein [Bacteroidia bacterium]
MKYENRHWSLPKTNQKEGVALIKEGVGRIYWHLGNFNEALKQHFDALLLYTDAGDESSAANTLSLIGQDYADGGRYSQALIFFKSLESISGTW